MNKITKVLLMITGILTLFGCTNSPLSHQQILNIDTLRAEITIQQDPYHSEKNSVTVRLSDTDNKQINNDAIIITVNNQALDLYTKQEAYYTEFVSYVAENIQGDDSFYFEIMLWDDQIFPLAYIKQIMPITSESISYPKMVKITNDAVVEWSDLGEFNHFTLWKSYYTNNDSRSLGGWIYNESTITEVIDTVQGEHITPSSFYYDATTTATSLNIGFEARKQWLMHPQLLTGSTIQIFSHVWIDIDIWETWWE